MASFAEEPFDPDLVITDEMRTVLIGMAVGAIEAPGGCAWSVQDDWIERHLPCDFQPVRSLLVHGYLWAREKRDGTTYLGLTEGALRWMRDTFGMPPGDVDEAAVWIITILEPQFMRRGRVAQEIAPELTYSPAEAKNAHAMLDRLTERGNASPQAIEDYRAHVVRHTIRTVH